MVIERIEVVVPVIALVSLILELFLILHLELVIANICLRHGMIFKVFWACKNVRVECVKGSKCVVPAVVIVLFLDDHFLDGFL
jgi:hypothetical protein